MARDDLEHRLLTGLERVGSVLRTLRRQSAQAEGVTGTQARVLRILARHGVVGLRGVELSRELGVSRASGAETVAALVGRALVQQVEDPTDGRARLVRLTERGREVHARLAHWDDSAGQVLDGLEDAERIAMLRSLVTTIQGLEASGLIPEARVCPSCEHFQEDPDPRAEAPHRCALTGDPIGPGDLQVDCDGHRHVVVLRRG
ncbi:MAG: MarR family transcriptional regulator [Deltaproteobacteria bacterium]|nr:MarR family transcriptional regulator [Deltaproteobacteria bacterium]